MTRAEMRPYEINTLRREDVDPVAVQRLVAGDIPEHATVGDRDAAIRQLHAAGLSDPQIGKRIGVSVSCVRHRRKSLGLATNNPQHHSKGATDG